MLPFINFKLMREGAQIPKRGTDGSGGYDFFAPEDGFLDPGEKRLLNSGVAHDMPGALTMRLYLNDGPTFVEQSPILLPIKIQGVLFDRSGLGGKKGIKLSFHGLIDNDYRGEILLSIKNDSPVPFSWKKGERLCQIAYVPMYAGEVGEVKTLDETKRGDGGFGSTGK